MASMSKMGRHECLPRNGCRGASRQGVAGFFRKFGGVDFETGGFEVEGILNHLTGCMGKAGRKFKVRQRGLSGEVFGQQRHIDGFAAAMFYRIYRYYPDTAFLNQRTYPVLRGTAELWRSLATWDNNKKGYMLPVMQSLSEDFREKNLLESVLAAKWCLQTASRYATIVNKDIELSNRWKEISEKLIIPQNDIKYVESSGKTGEREGAGYQGVRGVVYLGYPVSELISQLDKTKVYRTFDDAWIRNKKGAGMISFVAGWNALSESFNRRGNETLQYLDVNLQCLDKSGVSLREVAGNPNDYFITSYTAYINAVISMLLQSYDGETNAFPAIPNSWKDVEFYNLPGESDIRVSGKMKDGKVVWLDYQKNGKKIVIPNKSVHL